MAANVLQYCKNTANVTTVTHNLIEMREKVFDLLRGTSFRVVIFNDVSPSLNVYDGLEIICLFLRGSCTCLLVVIH